MKQTLILIITVLMMGGAGSPLLPGVACAFHEGGEGYCEGCHLMREVANNQFEGTSGTFAAQVDGHSLVGSDPSSTCLRCHAKAGTFYNVFSNDGSIFTPGGDFYWLKKTFTRTYYGIVYKSLDDSHGHNIIAAEYGLIADRMLTLSPGGIYPSAAMGCTSCHNPHGLIADDHNYSKDLPFPEIGNFRLLGGIGYSGGNQATGLTFNYPAPVAVADSKDWAETDYNHTAYGSGMSEWCGNCHDRFLSDKNKHTSGSNAKMENAIISNYNSYIRTGDISGSYGGTYFSLVPFELGIINPTLLDPSSTSGPAPGKANVMCLTCHRAHASAFHDKGRWDFRATFIADSLPQYSDSGVTGNDVINSYYGRNMLSEFGKYQRQFCNKCHLQD